MKKQFYGPFIGQLIVTSLLYIGTPVIFLLCGTIKISTHQLNGVLTLLFVAIIYSYYVMSYLLPGVYAFLDLLTGNCTTEKMNYVGCIVSKHRFVSRVEKIDLIPKKTAKLSDSYYLTVILANNRGKSLYRTTFFHQMEQGKNYTVTYGKLSKVLMSVQDNAQKEVLLFDVG